MNDLTQNITDEKGTEETMTPFMNKDEVLRYLDSLKKYVKQSNIDGQNHLDVSLVDANKRDDFYKSLTVLRKAIDEKILNEKEYKEYLGI